MVHISDIDATVETERVLEAILKLVGSAHILQITVRSLTPNSCGSQVTTVAIQGKSIADKVIEAGKIRIEWVNFSPRQRVSLTRCQRCLEYGHHTAKCEGENRVQACRNCGGKSYQEKDCKCEGHKWTNKVPCIQKTHQGKNAREQKDNNLERARAAHAWPLRLRKIMTLTSF
ncbi:hypothetical protein JTB14_001443 [Gonioctena quinquepunctata]|nr:hypothetical protein JTB14_001443 [Gonioctena quinquepunctata]